jgi:hypothetical protein
VGIEERELTKASADAASTAAMKTFLHHMSTAHTTYVEKYGVRNNLGAQQLQKQHQTTTIRHSVISLDSIK